MPARGGGPPNNGQWLSWLIGPASSMAGLAQTAQQWSVRAARSVCGWYHCTPLGGVRKVRTQEKMYTYLYRLVHSWVRKLGGIAQPRSDFCRLVGWLLGFYQITLCTRVCQTSLK